VGSKHRAKHAAGCYPATTERHGTSQSSPTRNIRARSSTAVCEPCSALRSLVDRSQMQVRLKRLQLSSGAIVFSKAPLRVIHHDLYDGAGQRICHLNYWFNADHLIEHGIIFRLRMCIGGRVDHLTIRPSCPLMYCNAHSCGPTFDLRR
jgi:hypothetical protein